MAFEFGDRVSKARGNIQRISVLVEKGIYPPEILEKAKEDLNIILGETGKDSNNECQGTVPDNSGTSEAPSQPDEAFLRGIEQYVQDHPAPYNIYDLERATGRSKSSLSKIKSLGEAAKSLGIGLGRGKGRKNKFSSQELRQLAVKIGSPNPRMSEAAKRTEQGLEVEPVFDHVSVPCEIEDDKKELRQKIQEYIDAHPQYFYSTKDLYIVTERSQGSLKTKQIEEVMRRHGIVPGKKKTHKYRMQPDEFMAIASDVGFPRVRAHTSEEVVWQNPVTARDDVVLIEADTGFVDKYPDEVGHEKEITPRQSEIDPLNDTGQRDEVVNSSHGNGTAQGEDLESITEKRRREKEEREKAAERERVERVKQTLKIDLTHMFLTHLSNYHGLTGLKGPLSIQRNATTLLENNLPSDTQIKDLVEGNEAMDHARFIIDLFVEVAKDLGSASVDTDELAKSGRFLSGKEKQIVSMFGELRGIKKYIGYLIVELYNHFDSPVPVEFRNAMPQNISPDRIQGRGRGPNMDRSKRIYIPPQGGLPGRRPIRAQTINNRPSSRR